MTASVPPHKAAAIPATLDTTRIDDTRIKAVRPLITPALLQEWLPATAQALELVEQLQDLSAQGALRVRLACTEGFAAAFMPLVMAGFRQAHPQVQLQLQVAVPQEVSALVLRGEADLALKYSTAPEKGLQVLHSAIAPIYAVMPAQHPLARQRSVSVADVVRYPLLLGAANTTGRQLFDLSCAVQGLRYVPAVEDNFSSA